MTGSAAADAGGCHEKTTTLRMTVAVNARGGPGSADSPTVTSNVVLLVSSPSLAVSVMVELPDVPWHDTATVRLVPEPPSTSPASGATAGFDVAADTVTAPPSGSLTVKARGPVDPLFATVKHPRSAGTVPNTGGWFTPLPTTSAAARV